MGKQESEEQPEFEDKMTERLLSFPSFVTEDT